MDLVRDLVAAGVTTLVVAQHRDRLARTPAYHYLLHLEFEEYGCKVRSLNDSGDDFPEGKLTDGILDQLAKFERAKTAERTRRSKLQKAREGKMLAVHGPPYGFKYNEGTRAIFSARLWKRRRRPRLSPQAVERCHQQGGWLGGAGVRASLCRGCTRS
jgi:DNA invertase Pin-like site-specific DNA recombinase